MKTEDSTIFHSDERTEEDFETAKSKSRGFLKFKCRFELSEKDPSTPIQSTSKPRVTTTAKKRLSSHPSLTFELSDPTSPITKQGRRVPQPRSAIMPKVEDTYPAIEEYFAEFVKERIEEYIASQNKEDAEANVNQSNDSHSNVNQSQVYESNEGADQSNVRSIEDRPQLSAMRSTIVYESDESNTSKKHAASAPVSSTPKASQGLREVGTPSDVDQLQSSPAMRLYGGSQPPNLQGLKEGSEEEIETEEEPPRNDKRDEGYSSPIEQFDDHESLPASQIPPSAQPHPAGSLTKLAEEEHETQSKGQEEQKKEQEPAADEQSAEMSQPVSETEAKEHLQKDAYVKQEDAHVKELESHGQPEEPQQQQEEPQEPQEPSQTQPSPPSTQSTQLPFQSQVTPQSSPFKRPSLPQEKAHEGQDEELDLSKLFGGSTQGPRQPRRSIQAVLGDEKDDEATEKLMGGEKDDNDEVMTDYESDDTEDQEREMTKINKSTQAGRRGSSDDNLDNIDDMDEDDDEGEANDEQEPARNAPPVVHSTSNFEAGAGGSPTASERAVSAQVNASMSANQSFGGDMSVLDGARGQRKSDMSLGQVDKQPQQAEEQFLGDNLQNTSANAQSEQTIQHEEHAESHPPSTQPEKPASPQKSPKKEREQEQAQGHTQTNPINTQNQLESDNIVRTATSCVNNLTSVQMNAPTQAPPESQPEQSQGTVIPDSQPATQEESRTSLKRTRDDNTSDEDDHIQNTKRQRMESRNNGTPLPPTRARHSEGGIQAPPRKIAMPPRLSINFDDLVKKSSTGPQSSGRTSSSFLPLSEIVKDKTRYAIESPMASPRASPAVEARTRPVVQRVKTSDPDGSSSSSSSESESENSESSDEEVKKPRRKSVVPGPVSRLTKMNETMRRASGSVIPAERRAGAGVSNGAPERVTRSRVKAGGLADM